MSPAFTDDIVKQAVRRQNSGELSQWLPISEGAALALLGDMGGVSARGLPAAVDVRR